MICICKNKIYTTRYVYLISLFCTTIIYIFISVIFNSYNKNYSNSSILKFGKNGIVKVQFNNNITYSNNTKEENKKDNTVKRKEKEENTTDEKWYIKIPKIDLEAKISEGTTKEVLDFAVGHFEETSKLEGNVCLAAHNRGYRVNYFKNLKLLKKGDNVIYKIEEDTKEYFVDQNIIITDEDWSYLEKTEENVLTLITCVENEPSFRRCIRCIEKERS